jgi:hypothetical protein
MNGLVIEDLSVEEEMDRTAMADLGPVQWTPYS